MWLNKFKKMALDMSYFHTVLIISSVWAASGRDWSGTIATVWLAFAVLIYFFERKSSL